MNKLNPPEKLKNASDCQSMQEVRYEIDRLDEILVELIYERQCFMDAAARIKGSRDLVRDNQRVEQVVANVLAASAKVGLNLQIAEKVWRTMIEECIQYELKSFDRQKSEDKI